MSTSSNMSHITKHNHSLYWRILVIVILGMIVQFGLFPTQGVRAETTNSDPESYQDIAIGASSLVLQPIYLAAKLAIGVTGTVISGATLLATGGDEEMAQEIFDKSWASPWGVPELFKTADEKDTSKN